MIEDVTACFLALLMTGAKALEHIWARTEHDHPARRPLLAGLVLTDPLHLASGVQTAGTGLLLAMVLGWERLWLLLPVAIAGQGVWWAAKTAGGKDWPNKFTQVARYVRRR